jgi:hypothetical protein
MDLAINKKNKIVITGRFDGSMKLNDYFLQKVPDNNAGAQFIAVLSDPGLTTGVKSVEDNYLPSVSIYPVPAKNSITVKVQDCPVTGSEISISNILGEVLYNKSLKASGGECREELFFDLPPGTYCVRVTSTHFSGTRKIVVN